MYYASNTFSARDIATLKAFVRIIGNQNARAIRSPLKAFVPWIRVPSDGPIKYNKAARDRLRSAQIMANKYNWRSLEIGTSFDRSGT